MVRSPMDTGTGSRRQAGEIHEPEAEVVTAHLPAVRSRRNGGHGDYTAAGQGQRSHAESRVPSGTTPTSALYWGRRSTRAPGGMARPAGLRQRAETRCSSSRRDTWIEIPFPPLVDEQTWDRAQAIKKDRTSLVQAEHQDLLPATASPPVRRVWAALLLPVQDS